MAYFAGEPRQSQSQLDPFVFADVCRGPTHKGVVVLPPGNPVLPSGGSVCTGGRRYGDSWNYVLGMDLNQFVHWLNPNQSLFITTRSSQAPQGRRRPGSDQRREARCLPTARSCPCRLQHQATGSQAGASEPVLIHQPVDQFLQTLLIATSYYSGQVSPSLTLFYDWSSAFVRAAADHLSRDPFRFTFSYSYLTAQSLKGASGVSLLRDRDNVLFQFEYVI